MSTSSVIQTSRLRLHGLFADSADDCAFMLRLLNEPSFIQNIGDRGVRDLGQARDYVRDGPEESYRVNGFGLYRVELASTGQAVGTCGLVRRDWLPQPDLGYAFLPEFTGHGYAREAAAGVLAHARHALQIQRILSITTLTNLPSIRLLEALGFNLQSTITNPQEEILNLFVSESAR